MDKQVQLQPSKTLKETIDSFSDETSLHGFRNVIHSKYAIYRRMVWGFIVLVAVSCYLYLLSVSIRKYYEFHSHTRVTRNETKAMDFPAVSICEQNIFPRSTLALHGDLEKYIIHYHLNTTHLLSDEDKRAAEEILANVSLADTIYSSAWRYYQKYLMCMFDRRPIRCSDFMWIEMSEESLCFTFHPINVQEGRSRLQTKRPGYQYGLNILLGIDREEYLISAAGGVGLKVVIHEPDVHPRVNEGAISLQAGMEAYISMERVSEKVLGIPYSSVECEADTGPREMDHISMSHYNYEGCMLNCMMDRSFAICNCTYEVKGIEGHTDFCTLKDFYSCILCRFRDYMDRDCGCLYPCESVHYETSLSSLYFPSPMYVHQAQQNNWTWQTQEELHQNAVNIFIYFRSLQSMRVEQVPSYTYDVLAADMGGLLGLFVGASLITLLEVGEFLALMVGRRCWRRRVGQVGGGEKTPTQFVKTQHK